MLHANCHCYYDAEVRTQTSGRLQSVSYCRQRASVILLRRLGLGMLHSCAVGLSGAVFGLIVVSGSSPPGCYPLLHCSVAASCCQTRTSGGWLTHALHGRQE